MGEPLQERWPRRGDSLFASGSGWETQARFTDFGRHWFLSYAIAYRKAAEAVIEQVESGRLPANYALLPAFYLYRHYVELMLKGLVNLGTMLEHRRSNYPQGHHIDQLWRECRLLLERFVPSGSKVDTDAVESCIAEMASLDPSGQMLRYGEDKKQNPVVPGIAQVDLANVRDVMNRMSGFLEGSYDYLDELVQTQAGIDSHYSY